METEYLMDLPKNSHEVVFSTLSTDSITSIIGGSIKAIIDTQTQQKPIILDVPKTPLLYPVNTYRDKAYLTGAWVCVENLKNTKTKSVRFMQQRPAVVVAM